MWVIIALASLAVLITLLLYIPLDLVIHLNLDGKSKFNMKLLWLCGIVSKDIRKRKRTPVEEATVQHRRKPRDWGRDARAIFQILRTKGMLRQIMRLLRGIFTRIRIRELAANLRIGLDNPADTGLLFAFIAPVNLLASFFPHQIRLEPSFHGEALLGGHFSSVVRMRPIQLIGPLTGFAFSLPTIRAMKTLVLSRWRRKQEPTIP